MANLLLILVDSQHLSAVLSSQGGDRNTTQLDCLVLKIPNENTIIILLDYSEELIQMKDPLLICLFVFGFDGHHPCLFWLHIKFKISLLQLVSIIIIPLLMPKVIQPRRHDKQLTAEEFWKIRDEGKQPKQVNAFQRFREEEVQRRHRFSKPSEKAKSFNPLTYILKSENKHENNDLYAVGTQDENTFVAEYLTSVQNKLNPSIKEIKELVLGRKSIIYNFEKICKVLWDHMYLEETFPLLQAVIKDAKGEKFDIWLKVGLKQFAKSAAEKCRTDFNEVYFRNFYQTICIFMESYYQKIAQNIQVYFIEYASQLMKHTNKYIRKFSVQSFSYILSNLSEEQYDEFMNLLVRKQQEGFFNDQLSLASMLLQRLKIVKGCLTAASMTHFMTQIENLEEIFCKQTNSQSFVAIASQYICLVLTSMNCRQGSNESQILFDFVFILKALQTFSQKNIQRYIPILITGFSDFLATYFEDTKKFAPYNSIQTRYLKEVWSTFGSFFRNNVAFFKNVKHIKQAISVLWLKNGSQFYLDSNIIEYCKSNESTIKQIIQSVYQYDGQMQKSVAEIILLLSRDLIRGFILESKDDFYIYRIILLLKRYQIQKLIDLSWLQITNEDLINKLEISQFQQDLVIILRLLTFLKISQSALELFSSKIELVNQRFMGNYNKYITDLLDAESQRDMYGEQFFNYKNFTKELIIYSHHEIGWLSHIFNIYQAFVLLQNHLGVNLNRDTCIWDRLIISRPSALKLLVFDKQSDGNLLKQSLITLLESRNRQVRYQAVNNLCNSINNEEVVKILSSLLLIDQNNIDLENQREVKRVFVNLEQNISAIKDKISDVDQLKQLQLILLKWCLGFAFTGFKLVETAFISFMKTLIDLEISSLNTGNVLMPFLAYYNYKHSRQYEFDISDQAPVNHLTKAFTFKVKDQLKTYINEDFEISRLETAEWIGLERIAEVIKTSSKAKKSLSPRLNRLIQAYFNVQFSRQQRQIENQNKQAPPKSFLMPIKQRFLINILKICPNDLLPPFACLHYTRQIFFEIGSVKNIKRNNWQTMWEHHKTDQPRKKMQIAEKVSTTVNLEHLSGEEQKMYISYLWKDIIQSNRHKKRIIIDHIRNYLPSAIPIIFDLLFQQLHLHNLDFSHFNESTVSKCVKRLKLMNRRSLLNGMFILKAILIHLRQQIHYEQRIKAISLFILSIIQIVYNSQQAAVQEDKQQDESVEEIEDEENENAQQETKHTSPYKQHRKQLQKLLQTLFTHHQLQNESVEELLEYLLTNTNINLSKSARHSVPGLLLVLKIVSAQKEYCLVLTKIIKGELVPLLNSMIQADEQGERPLSNCFDIWLQIMSNMVISKDQHIVSEEEEQYQKQINQSLKKHSCNTLNSILSYSNASNSKNQKIIESKLAHSRKKQAESFKILLLISKFMIINEDEIEEGWQTFIWDELSKLARIKKILNDFQCSKLSLLISILSRYIAIRNHKVKDSANFLKKIIGILPNIKDIQQRQQIAQLMISNYRELKLTLSCVQLVSKMGQVKKTALQTTMDFTAFFEACNQYLKISSTFSLIDHEYYIYNLICFSDNEQLSVRRAVSSSCSNFLQNIENLLKSQAISQQNQSQSEKALGVLLTVKVYRVFLEMLTKQKIMHSQSVYWNIVDNIDLFFAWMCQHAQIISTIFPNSNILLYPHLIAFNDQKLSYLKLLGSISQANKLKGLKLIISMLQKISQQKKNQIMQWPTEGRTDFPNPISKTILIILEYLVMKPTENKNKQSIKSNLSSTLSKSSLEMMSLVSSFLKENTVKKELKRLVSKLKYSETESKKNIALIKMIGELIDGVNGEKVNEILQVYLKQHGFQQFHQKITQFSRNVSRQNEKDSSSDDQYEDPQAIRKERLPDYYDHLEELESQEAINRNFLFFDKKMMELQLEEQEEFSDKNFALFLKKSILLPLRTMLMMENKAKQQQEQNKGRVLLSVTVTKVLLRLPLDVFLREFQKVVGRLGRLLKKRQVEVRENARNCLCEIAKSVGSQLLYAIVLQLKFNLKNNFDSHVLNYTLYKVLESMNLGVGELDYCLPLLLPPIIDEIFGQSSSQKDMVEKREVKTLKMQAKKHKGLEILQIICRNISAGRISFIIEYLEKFLREHLVTEVNLGKYDQMLGFITSGLGQNTSVLDSSNATVLLPSLADPVNKLRQQIKQIKWDDGPKHQNTLKTNWKRKKAGKDEILSLQEQAGRNRSIFKKMNKEVGEKRNQEIIASSLIQFYVSLLSFFLKKHVFNLNSISSTPALSEQFLSLLGFLTECIDQRDNRLVTKSLKTLHIALSWKTSSLQGELQPINDRFKSFRKQTSRKILLLIQQLTLADDQLLKQCFVFLNDLITESTISLQMLPNFIAVIKLHTPTTEDQPHIPQTYHLLRTLIYKCPQYLYHPLLDELHLFVRLRLPVCRNKELRDLSCTILSAYLRPRKQFMQSLQIYNNLQKKQGQQTVDYEKKIQQQLKFYLSNLQSPGQQGVLKLLDDFIENREQDQLQIYSELLLLGLITVRTNQIDKLQQHPTDKLIVKILKRINQGKVYSLIEKCLSWMKKDRHESIRICGTSFLRLILQNAQVKLNQSFFDKYVLCPQGIIERGTIFLKQQIQAYEKSKMQNDNNSYRIDKKWGDILDKMDVEAQQYSYDPSVIEFLTILSLLLDSAIKFNNSLTDIVPYMWKLLHLKDVVLIEALIQCLCKLTLLPLLYSYSQSHNDALTDDRNLFSIKKVLSGLVFNHHKPQIIEKIFAKLLEQQQKFQSGTKLLNAISWFLVGLSLKAHIKTTIYMKELPILLYLLNHLTLIKLSNQIDFLQIMFASPNFPEKLLELTVKLGENPLISHESKMLVNETTQILKQKMGVAEYFKAVGEFQVKKRQKKADEKTRIAQMAILNPQQFIGQRKGRRL